jgi:hypothetical protein
MNSKYARGSLEWRRQLELNPVERSPDPRAWSLNAL